MARRANDDPTRQSVQIVFMVEPDEAGLVEAWRLRRGVRTKADIWREIWAAGLAELDAVWQEETGGRPSRPAIKRAVESMPRKVSTARSRPGAVQAA